MNFNRQFILLLYIKCNKSTSDTVQLRNKVYFITLIKILC